MINNNDITFDFIFNEDYILVHNGSVLNILNKPFTKTYIIQMENYFKCREEYEKCEIINNFYNSRFPHGLLWTLDK